MYYFSEINYRGNHAGTKARNDIEQILSELGAKPVNSKRLELTSDKNESQIKANIKNRFGYLRYFIDIKRIKNEIILIQYPMLSFDIAYDYIDKLAKHNRIIFIVHDIHSLRLHDANQIQYELSILNKGYGIILHTANMKKSLVGLGLKVKHIFILQYFDYLYSGDSIKETDGIVFAGNLQKSTFLPELITVNPQILFRLYGDGLTDQVYHKQNAEYCGSFPPNMVPAKLSGRFGLVWDGDNIYGSSGRLGEYTKINSPHKLSLYIAAGLPVLVWKEAAIAPLVMERNIGIVLDNLLGLDQLSNSISRGDYQFMREAVLKMRKSIINGEHCKKIILDAVKKCNE